MVDDDRFSGRVAAFRLGESYMDGRWGCDSINAFIDRALLTNLCEEVEKHLRRAWPFLRAKFSTVNL